MSRVFVIAEVGSVHDGSFGNAMKLVELASAVGADAVKFQTHIAAAETLRDAPMPAYFKGEPRYEYFERTAFNEEQLHSLKLQAQQQGLEFLSSPFSLEAVELLCRVGMQRWKIPSGEITNLPLIDACAATGCPVMLSSGMSSWSELDAAVEVVRKRGAELAVLQCTSEYPCPYESVGMNVMREMGTRYNVPVGLSDHTLTIFAPIVAVTMGASIIEKHLTFSRAMYGSDARHSLEPNEFAQMVEGIRAAESMCRSSVDKDAAAHALSEMKHIFQKSIVTVCDVPAGTLLTSDQIAFKKPGGGISPAELPLVVGRRTRRALPNDYTLSWEDLD
jgi:N-acetylneuraminate synthase